MSAEHVVAADSLDVLGSTGSTGGGVHRVVDLVDVGDRSAGTNVATVTDALVASGMRVATAAADRTAADLVVVLTDDYRNVELALLNGDMLAAGRPWLLAKPSGSIVWLGPVFHHGVTECWQCVLAQLPGDHELRAPLVRRSQLDLVQIDSAVDLAGRVIGAHLVALHATKWLAGAFPAAADVELHTLDMATLRGRTHRLDPGTRCAACRRTATPDHPL